MVLVGTEAESRVYSVLEVGKEEAGGSEESLEQQVGKGGSRAPISKQCPW